MQIFVVVPRLRDIISDMFLLPQHNKGEQKLYCVAQSAERWHLKNSARTCLSRNNIPVTLDHPQNLLSTIPAEAAFYWTNRPGEKSWQMSFLVLNVYAHCIGMETEISEADISKLQNNKTKTARPDTTRGKWESMWFWNVWWTDPLKSTNPCKLVKSMLNTQGIGLSLTT